MRQRFGSWMFVVPLLAACSPDESETVSGQSFALTAQANVENALRGLYEAGSFLADSASLAQALAPLAGFGEACEVDVGCPTAEPCELAPAAECATGEVTVEDLQSAREDANEAVDELVKTLREKIFTPENLESEDADSATYLLGANVWCSDDEQAVAPASPTGQAPPAPGDSAPDPECEEQAQKFQVRLRLSSPSEGDIDVELLLTSSRRNPATLELHDDHVGVVIDLDEVDATLDALGEEVENLRSLSGTVAFELVRYAALDYGLRYSVREAVHVGLSHDDGQPIDFKLAASEPTFELRLDGNARKLTGTYDVGALGLIAPLDLFANDEPDSGELPEPSSGAPTPTPAPPSAPLTGTIDAFLAGLEGSVGFDGNQDELNLVGLGLGDASSTLKHDGTLIGKLDVNADAGRHFDLLIQNSADGDPTLRFSPTFDLRVLLNFSSLAAQIDDLPAYALNDELRASFEGAQPTLQPLADSGALRITSGTLNLTSAATPAANLSVPAGSCLVELDGSSPAAHELLGQFAVSTCP